MENSTHELAVDSMFTALKLLMKEKDYSEITITDIVKRAGFSRMAFYRNYSSKDEILTHRLRKTLDHFMHKMEEKEISDDMELWTEFFEFLINDEAILCICKAGLYGSLLEVHEQYTVQYFEKRYGWYMEDRTNRMRAYKRMGSVAGLMSYYMENPADTGPGELAKLLLE